MGQSDPDLEPLTVETECLSGTKFVAVLDEVNFDEAKTFCFDRGATLARISNNNENFAVVNLSLSTPGDQDRFWIGR